MREFFKPHFTNGAYIANHSISPDAAEQIIKTGEADMVSFGWLYVANEKVSDILKSNHTLKSFMNVSDPSKIPTYIYSREPEGFTDMSVYLQ